MSKEQFRDKLRLSRPNIILLETINGIINEYSAKGYSLTLRQLYYQLVSRDIVPNKDAEYKKVGKILTKGRMGGMVDWEAIEDRVRVPKLDYWATGIPDALDTIVSAYKLNRQKGQDNYIELWVEKEALSGILRRKTNYYHIRLMVNKGYSSCTAIHDAYKRIEKAENRGQQAHILYLGDHDPSGLDMIRDIEDRLNEFGVEPIIKPIGLTMEQIKKYNPPTNPAKITDSRAKWYIENYGDKSWEVDALNPEILHQLIDDNVELLIDIEMFNDQIAQEADDKEKLQEFINEMSE